MVSDEFWAIEANKVAKKTSFSMVRFGMQLRRNIIEALALKLSSCDEKEIKIMNLKLSIF